MGATGIRAFWDALERAGILSMKEFRELWLKAVRQDPAAQRLIFRITQESSFANEKVNAWASERVIYLTRQRELRDEDKKKTVTKRKSLWEKSRDKLGRHGARVINGGLPSLGKRSK